MKSLIDCEGVLSRGLADIRTQFQVPAEFPQAVTEQAELSARRTISCHADWTDRDFVTLDPYSSRDLDQAFAIEQAGADIVLHYAIADVASFVGAGDALDREAWVRGETIYMPDGKASLYPVQLSEGAASLLPGEDRPAVLWRLQLDADGELTSVDVRRSIVRSRAQLDYPSFASTGGERVSLLQRVGELRQARERDRGVARPLVRGMARTTGPSAWPSPDPSWPARPGPRRGPHDPASAPRRIHLLT